MCRYVTAYFQVVRSAYTTIPSSLNFLRERLIDERVQLHFMVLLWLMIVQYEYNHDYYPVTGWSNILSYHVNIRCYISCPSWISLQKIRGPTHPRKIVLNGHGAKSFFHLLIRLGRVFNQPPHQTNLVRVLV